jgi:ABC-2 type transport system ATP-binding protein
VVFLDELTTGLDPQARHAIWKLVREVQSRGKTVFLTTHLMEEAERLCDRVAILEEGQIVALDTPQALVHNLSTEDRVSFSLDGILSANLKEFLSKLGELEVQGDRVVIQGTSKGKIQLVTAVVNALSDQRVTFHELRTEQPTLEDVFLKLTGRQIRG